MIINPYIFGGFDPDAQAFITAANITNTTQQNAINTLVVDLKGYGVWTKMKAIYPFVGGTATSHSYNLKNTAQYQITWFGGVTHNSNGITGNGTNGYANTGLNSNTILNNLNIHLSVYTRTASTVGSFSNELTPIAGYSSINWLGLRTNNKTSGIASFTAGNDTFNVSASNTLNGFIVGSKTSNILKKLYRNSIILNTRTNTDNNLLPNANIGIFGAPGANYSNNNLAFSSIGDGLTDTEASNLYTAVQNYQVALSRNV
jgi:hypothetical protein